MGDRQQKVGGEHTRLAADLSIEDCGNWLGLSFLGDWMQAAEEGQFHHHKESAATTLARHLLKVRGKDGLLYPLEANPVQRSYEQNRGTQNIVLKARQLGITTWVAGRMFLRTILHPGTLTLQVAHNQTAAEEIFRIVQRFHSHLPSQLRNGLLRCSRDNRRQMVFGRLDSEYRVESAADANAGRGLTVQNLHCSEVARWPRDANSTLAGLRAALAPGGELVVESTPWGAAGCFYQLWCDAQEASMVRHFLPWWTDPSYVGPPVPPAEWTDEERGLAQRAGLDARQIGFRRQIKAQFQGIAMQEYAEDAEACFLASGECLFDVAALTHRLKSPRPPVESQEHGRLWVWLAPVQGRKYVIGVDPAEGGPDGDFTVLQVLDLQTGIQCAEWQDRRPLREAAQVVARTAQSYNNAVVAVERNNHGSGLLAHLEGRGLELYEHRGIPGWPTTSLTRPAMIELVGMALEGGEETLYSERFLRECRTFVRQKNGKAGAAAGCHDDCVMAMAVALSARAEIQQAGGKKKH